MTCHVAPSVTQLLQDNNSGLVMTTLDIVFSVTSSICLAQY